MSRREVVSKEDFISLLGEGFHTAFRKATDCSQSVTIWNAISKMPEKDWHEVLEFVYECVKGVRVR